MILICVNLVMNSVPLPSIRPLSPISPADSNQRRQDGESHLKK